jgi:hypothetical protein
MREKVIENLLYFDKKMYKIVLYGREYIENFIL